MGSSYSAAASQGQRNLIRSFNSIKGRQISGGYPVFRAVKQCRLYLRGKGYGLNVRVPRYCGNCSTRSFSGHRPKPVLHPRIQKECSKPMLLMPTMEIGWRDRLCFDPEFIEATR